MTSFRDLYKTRLFGAIYVHSGDADFTPSTVARSPNTNHFRLTTSSKFDPSQVVDVFVCITSSEVGAVSYLAPRIGPLGLSLKKINKDITKETVRDMKGLRVIVNLTVQNR
ncbi:60S ribosomal protein L12 [Striga asiatica]|uniref:60S ribosomal protein L12 n=1 Tax=Striga asiatica TaxID=4170 RepID=A0A5A7R605_STRAF|nr:60S ribosomal protein L12 [Striga asiatica]